jgi:hypothetical protein
MTTEQKDQSGVYYLMLPLQSLGVCLQLYDEFASLVQSSILAMTDIKFLGWGMRVADEEWSSPQLVANTLVLTIQTTKSLSASFVSRCIRTTWLKQLLDTIPPRLQTNSRDEIPRIHVFALPSRNAVEHTMETDVVAVAIGFDEVLGLRRQVLSMWI